ncbi:MAG TPA: 6-phosphogluconolactonase [Methylomirabilota bacterium]|nr:6-phosphogluconolactonase [Methylomirabilota bacterium]
MSTVRSFDDADAVAQAGAEEFVTLAAAAAGARGRFMVALAGGSTPRRMYRLLAEPAWRDRVAWDRVEVFWGDERAVPPDHADSNYHMAATALLERVPVPSGRVHRIRAEAADLADAAREYQAEIARVFGVPEDGPPPAFDLILLGMGADGHTASLFPGTTGLDERRRWVVSHAVPSMRTERVTLTLPIINRAREIRFLVTGEDKAGRLREALTPPRGTPLPVQRVAPEAGRLVWLADRAAAGTPAPVARS